MKKSWVFILVASVSGLTACHRRAAAPAPQIRPVLSILVAAESTKGASFAGTVEARYESSLSFRVLGRMVARDASVGDKVEKGARLATLDGTPFQLALRNAEADLAKADAKLKLARVNEARQRQLFNMQNLRGGQEYAAGNLDLRRALGLLRDQGYNDWLVVEQDTTPLDPTTVARRNRTFLEALLDELGIDQERENR